MARKRRFRFGLPISSPGARLSAGSALAVSQFGSLRRPGSTRSGRGDCRAPGAAEITTARQNLQRASACVRPPATSAHQAAPWPSTSRTTRPRWSDHGKRRRAALMVPLAVVTVWCRRGSVRRPKPRCRFCRAVVISAAPGALAISRPERVEPGRRSEPNWLTAKADPADQTGARRRRWGKPNRNRRFRAIAQAILQALASNT